jgi:hypothetical protein
MGRGTDGLANEAEGKPRSMTLSDRCNAGGTTIFFIQLPNASVWAENDLVLLEPREQLVAPESRQLSQHERPTLHQEGLGS